MKNNEQQATFGHPDLSTIKKMSTKSDPWGHEATFWGQICSQNSAQSSAKGENITHPWNSTIQKVWGSN